MTPRMPAEWEAHKACILLYPHNTETYPYLSRAQSQVLQVARSIAQQGGEQVWLICRDEDTVNDLKESSSENLLLSCVPSNDTWARDTAPTFCLNEKNELVAVDWQFNAYGGPEEGCYWPCDLDQALAWKICEQFPTVLDTSAVSKHVRVPLILEGGSIHSDGQGTLLVTAECLLHPNRNPTKSQSEIEQILKVNLGAAKIVWLPQGLAFDEDTNGHVDNFACFVRPGVILLAWTDDTERDLENFQRCRAAQAVLGQTTDAMGRTFEIHKLYLPSPPLFYSDQDVKAPDGMKAVGREAGQRLAASYVNFYIANSAVVVPQFGVAESDQAALKKLQELFPDRKAVGVPSREILLGGGNIHCITQQVPSAKR